MKTLISIFSLYILIGCGNTPRAIEDQGNTTVTKSEEPFGNQDDSLLDDTPVVGDGQRFAVSFPGGAFSGGAVTGEGINCNRTSAEDCEKTFASGSNLRFEIPTTVSVQSQPHFYSGKIQCNGEEKSLAASGGVVILEIQNLDQDYSCSFHFAPN